MISAIRPLMFIPKPKFLISIRHFVAAAEGKRIGGHPGFKIGTFIF